MPNITDTPDSMILRFRDLSVNEGETIQKHSEIVAEKGCVWWGWWKKQGETIPVSVFQRFVARAKQTAPFQIYLFDTGTLTLFRTTLSDIYWNAQGNFVGSPDRELTPSYYGESAYLAWFKLGPIEKDLDGEAFLKARSYVRVDGFFETNKSIFSDFYDKQIASFQELKHQERTIWFIRPRRAEDRTHEIHVYESGRVVPSNFPVLPQSSPSNVLLLMSDPHFSDGHHEFPLVSSAYGWDLSEALRKHLESSMQVKEVGGVLISGDLTWKADASEFGMARKFIDDVRSWATLQYNNFVICPGNHDIAFSNEPWTKGQAPSIAPKEAVANFSDFYQQLYAAKPNKWFCSGRRFLLANAKVVEIVSLNSSTLRQTPDVFQGQGFIGEDQLNYSAQQIGWHPRSTAPRAFRIVMLHHHVVPIVYRELPGYEQQSSVVYDAGALCRWLAEHQVDLVLHGHMHQAALVKEARTVNLRVGSLEWHEFTIAALGSAGVKVDHTTDRKNTFGTLEFLRDKVELTLREVTPTNKTAAEDAVVAKMSIGYR